MLRIAIIGGGASGLICAARCSKILRHSHKCVSISVYESSNKVGRSILRSGNGRCNLSNSDVDFELYRNSEFVRAIEKAALCSCTDEQDNFLSHTWYTSNICNGHTPSADEVFFVTRGLLLRAESEGRLYPYPNKSSVVLDALLNSIDPGVVNIHPDCSVKKIVSHKKDSQTRYAIHFIDNRVEHADVVIIACGGNFSQGVLSSIEPTLEGIIAPTPVLCPLAVEEKLVASLDNIRVRCKVTLARAGNIIASETGEVLFRKYGVSGIAVFNLSRYAKTGDKLELDFIPETNDAAATNLIRARCASLSEVVPRASSGVSFARVLEGVLLPEVAAAALARAGLQADSICETDADAEALSHALKHFSLAVAGPAEKERAQVHRGGLSVEAVDSATLESKQLPGLYIVGEALDVDGPCGGYNLHFAWISGLLAASSICKRLEG